MQILAKQGDEIHLLALPGESAAPGTYLVVEDAASAEQWIVQVYEESYFDPEGIEHELLRDAVIRGRTPGAEHEPANYALTTQLLRDLRLVRCKIRRWQPRDTSGSLLPTLPSRVTARIRAPTEADRAQWATQPHAPIEAGTDLQGTAVQVPATALDGRLTVITGRKESGKSHLAKILARGLVSAGALALVFDLNDEYQALGLERPGTVSHGPRSIALQPGRNLRLALGYLGLRALLALLQHIFELPGTSLREVPRLWDAASRLGPVSLHAFLNLLPGWRCNEFVREALLSRFQSLLLSGLIADADEEGVRLEDLLRTDHGGVALIVSLARLPALLRRTVVELLLTKLLDLLEHQQIPPIFLLAEEAQLYLRDTHWDDLVTRMRHYGVSPIFITNQPDAIPSSIYRQADNIFLFNFRNDFDLEWIARAAATDVATTRSLVRLLAPGHCLALGPCVADLPTIVRVSGGALPPTGQTRRFFQSPTAQSPARPP